MYCREINHLSRWGARHDVQGGEDFMSDGLSTRRKGGVAGENSMGCEANFQPSCSEFLPVHSTRFHVLN